MKKYKVLKELPGHIKGDILYPLGTDEDENGYYYTIRTLKEEGFIKEVRDIDLFEEELRKLMVKYNVRTSFGYSDVFFCDRNNFQIGFETL